MIFPELTSVKSDSAWPLVRLSSKLNGGTIHVSYLCDKHTVNCEKLGSWLSEQKVENAENLQKLKHSLYHELMPKALQITFVGDHSSMSTREVQPGVKLPTSLETLLNDELTKRTVY